MNQDTPQIEKRSHFELIFSRFNSPLLLKEIRGKFRSIRFLLTHFISVGLLSILIILTIFFLGIDNQKHTSYERIGQNLFLLFLLGQYLIVCFVFPAFSCTAIISERSNKAFDLLVTTTLSPWEIVWGKLTSSFAYIYIFLISTLPLLSISFLFGGVSPEYIFWAYLGLFGLSFFITVYALFASTAHTSISKAIGSTYISVFLFGLIFTPALAGGIFSLFDRQMTPSAYYHSASALEKKNLLITFFLFIHLFLSFTSLFFISAVNKIKPQNANKSTNMRIWFVYFLSICLGLLYLYYHNNHPSWNANTRLNGVFYTEISLWIILSIPIFVFTLEPICLPPRLFRISQELKGWKFPLRLFFPGAISGFCYSFGLAVFGILGFSLALFYLLDLQKSREFTLPAFGIESFWNTTTILIILSFTLSQLVLFLNLKIEAFRTKIVVLVAILLFVCLAPLLFLFIDHSEELFGQKVFTAKTPKKTLLTEASWFNGYYFNPFLLLYSSYVDLNYIRSIPKGYDLFLKTPFGTYPIHIVGGFLYLYIGILFAILNVFAYQKTVQNYRDEMRKSGYFPDLFPEN